MEATAGTQKLGDPARDFLGRAGRHFIGGEWVEPADAGTFESLDPATGRPIAELAQGGPADVDRAVSAAREAFEGGWAATAPHKRSALIWALAELIRANRDELAELESLDNGKPLADARGRHAAAVNYLRYYAGWATRSTARRSRSAARLSATRAASRSASAGRSSPGTSRC